MDSLRAVIVVVLPWKAGLFCAVRVVLEVGGRVGSPCPLEKVPGKSPLSSSVFLSDFVQSGLAAERFCFMIPHTQFTNKK